MQIVCELFPRALQQGLNFCTAFERISYLNCIIMYYTIPNYHLPSLFSNSAVQPSSALLWWIAFLWHRSACTTHRCTSWDDQLLRMEPQNFESTSRGSHSSIPWYKSENGKWASPTFSSFHVLIHKQNKEGKHIIHVSWTETTWESVEWHYSESTASLLCLFHHFGFQIVSDCPSLPWTKITQNVGTTWLLWW